MKVSRVRVTTLSDNTPGEGYKAEWGFSLLVETDWSRILFDTGASPLFVDNAATAGTSLPGILQIVLSHGHNDHTGGLIAALRATGPTTVIAHPGVWEAKYAVHAGEPSPAYIGLPFARAQLEKEGAIFKSASSPMTVSRGITTTGEIPLVSTFEHVDDSLLVMRSGALVPDSMPDDQALIIDTYCGLVVILGCAHRGVINTLSHACRLTGVSRIRAVIGGMHLFRAPQEQVHATLDALNALDVEQVVASHCTGSYASKYLADGLGPRFCLNYTGAQFTWSQS